ncbi:UDP-N-acetylmuramoyl-tripeptide--D-alanyl-D-alanine ligase [Serpentinimonas barnesii]|uniref:UDP-N-acetylmuramoyl-tripeptide--D-alanyl-D- alanine ligase n=1 Tax=Serpentinimonas barnesii TaxID=1458427 RepID=UPI001E5D9105|nr:Mur ligase family protein [Serpentinimonas barnesii]
MLQLLPLLAGARPIGRITAPVLRVHTDTRTLRPGDLFVALRGERFDGNDWLAQARAAGAVGAVAERGLAEAGLAGVEVPDARAALGELAQRWRARFELPLIAVTGSNGKTTVTQLIAAMLRAAVGEAALATEGNFNNDIGVPLTLLRLRPTHRLAVLELGMNHPGEIAALAALVQPTVALVNNAQREHQEFMPGVEAVAHENGSVLAALPPNGVAVFPADDTYSALWQQIAGPRRVLRFSVGATPEATEAEAEAAAAEAEAARVGVGRGEESEPATDEPRPTPTRAAGSEQGRGEESERVTDEPRPTPTRAAGAPPGSENTTLHAQVQWVDGAWALHLHTPAGPLHARLRLAGRHNLYNALAASACAIAAGVPLAAIQAGLEGFEPVAGRSRTLSLQRGAQTQTLIDDSYNANPDSVRAAIDWLAELPGPRLLLLGDMGEVGAQALAFHDEVLRHALARGIEQICVTGDWMQRAAAALQAQSPTAHGRLHAYPDRDALQHAALSAAEQAASVLVKGSRFMRMERLVQALQAATSPASAQSQAQAQPQAPAHTPTTEGTPHVA